MQRKALQVQVELDIHAVTCPGVFLCPNGKVSLQLYMLDSCIQTVCCTPVFPILCHEKFIFYKMFYNAQRLSDLQRLLTKERLYMELIQWQNSDVGNVLATFQTNLSELLYPSTFESSVAGVDIDLLMEPERSFPGVIAPKVEVSTKTIIEDTVLDAKKSSAFVVNPKVIPSKRNTNRINPIHLRKVCHSFGYHRSRKCTTTKTNQKPSRPPFVFKKVDDNLLTRKPDGLASYKGKCRCFSPDEQTGQNAGMYYDEKNYDSIDKLPQIGSTNWKTKNKSRGIKNCLCGSGHEEDCPVCSKYKYYFEDTSPTVQYPMSQTNRKSCVLQRDTKPSKNCTCQELGNTRSSRVIRCTSAKKSPNKSCSCMPKMSTLATKLHERLNQTLESYECDCGDTNSYDDTEVDCVCPDLRVGDFYKKFYRKAKSKIQCDKYITPCCI